jgi:hypothetical protein
MACVTQHAHSGRFAAAMIPVALFLSGEVTAQTSSTDANDTDVTQPAGMPPSATQVPASAAHPRAGRMTPINLLVFLR